MAAAVCHQRKDKENGLAIQLVEDVLNKLIQGIPQIHSLNTNELGCQVDSNIDHYLIEQIFAFQCQILTKLILVSMNQLISTLGTEIKKNHF